MTGVVVFRFHYMFSQLFMDRFILNQSYPLSESTYVWSSIVVTDVCSFDGETPSTLLFQVEIVKFERHVVVRD
jgi:hypothetical protein